MYPHTNVADFVTRQQQHNWQVNQQQFQLATLLDAALHTLAQPKKIFTKPPVQWIYIYGSVGTGKTALTQIMGQCAKRKGIAVIREHYLNFMRMIHEQLHQHKHKDPLPSIIKKYSKHCKLLILDEMNVEDIGDAMILAHVLQELHTNNISLVFTSNTHPKNLYKDGLQRVLFLPTIDLLMLHCQLFELNNQDYRQLAQNQIKGSFTGSPSIQWVDPNITEEKAKNFFLHHFSLHEQQTSIYINHRHIPIIAKNEKTLLATFSQLFCSNRSGDDFLSIAQQFQHVAVCQTPVLDDKLESAARRFIACIDALYDNNKQFSTFLPCQPNALYTATLCNKIFPRTVSRVCQLLALNT